MTASPRHRCACAVRPRGWFAAACLFLIPWAGASAGQTGALALSVDDVFPVAGSNPGLSLQTGTVWLAQASSGSTSSSLWETAVPPTDKWDWIKTTSGEWLKGELKVMYDGGLEFDSDEFDLQSLDWDDVAEVHATGEKRISIDTPSGPEIYVGKLTVSGDKVVIETAEGRREFPRSRLISITPGAESEWDNWSAKISLGVNFTRGNSEQTDFTMKLNVKRRTPDNRYVLDYLGNLSENAQSKTVNNHRLNTFFDMFVAKEYFFRPVFFEYYRDPFQNIDFRTTLGVGAGYHIIDSPDTTWDVSGGPAYRWTRYESVAPGESDEVSTPALVFGTYYDTTLTKTVDFDVSYNASIVNEESGTYTHHAIATFEIELTDVLDFDVSFVWDRTENPQTRSDGTTPKQDDFQLLLTLGVDI